MNDPVVTPGMADPTLEGDVTSTGYSQVVEEDFGFGPLELIPFDDPRLHTAPPEFDFVNDGAMAESLQKALFAKMFAWQGVGLSANQVGLPFKVFVMGTRQTSIAMFNPSLVSVSKETTLFREGCLSFPGLYLTLKRPTECVFSFQNFAGERVVQQFPGMAARIALHEYDHMLGVDFTIHASRFKVEWELKKLKKAVRKQAYHQIRNMDDAKNV